ISWEELNSYAAQTRAFASVAGWSATSVVIDHGATDGGVINAPAFFVTPNYFRTLETRLFAGRLFEQSRFDQLSPPELTAIISYDFAQQLDAVNPGAVIGRSITVNGTSVTIIGITAPPFKGPIQSDDRRT